MSDKNSFDSSEEYIKKLVLSVFSGIGFISEKVLTENVAYLSGEGFLPEERTIDKSLADFMLNNFGTVLLGLISNQNFRNAFKAAAGTELGLDSKDETFIKSVREEMSKGEKPWQETEPLTVDLGTFDPETAADIGDAIAKSIDGIKEYSSEFDELVSELTKDQKIDIGFAASNFGYIIRALSQNPIFRNYVRDIVVSVNEQLGINKE